MAAVSIERRPLADTGLSVSSLAMGGAKLGAFWQGRSVGAALRALRQAHDLGINFFETADCYGRGISERAIGKAFRSARDNVVIATKVGFLKTPLAIISASRASPGCRPSHLADLRGLGPGAEAAQCFAPAYVERAVERSLRRLDTERVELLLLHAPPEDVLRDHSFLPALQRLRAAGKIGHYGIACRTEAEASAALAIPGVACLEIPHNLEQASIIPSVLPEAQRLGIALVAMAPFGAGSLLRNDAGHSSEPTVQACLQFALQSPGVSSVLVGMSTPAHVEANVRAAARSGC
jgi:aryl-alcohol dehydrogenase-like predicted oxidoreductase